MELLANNFVAANMHFNEVMETNFCRKTDYALIYQAFQVVKSNLSNPVVISSIADNLYVSESKLYKAFMNYYNESPKKVFTKYKMELSFRELACPNHSLDYIAIKYGFGSGCQYSKSFKKIMGYSPRGKIVK